jgi:hypothetical protein
MPAFLWRWLSRAQDRGGNPSPTRQNAAATKAAREFQETAPLPIRTPLQDEKTRFSGGSC